MTIGWMRRGEEEDGGRSDATFWLEVVGGISGLVGEEVEEGKIIRGKKIRQERYVNWELKEEVIVNQTFINFMWK